MVSGLYVAMREALLEEERVYRLFVLAMFFGVLEQHRGAEYELLLLPLGDRGRVGILCFRLQRRV